MSEHIDDGGLAFPAVIQGHNAVGTFTEYHSGMTLRDWFAGMSLQGQCACPITAESWNHATMAEQAYRQADAMIAERNQKPKPE